MGRHKLYVVLSDMLAVLVALAWCGVAAGAARGPQQCSPPRAVSALKDLVLARHQDMVVFGTEYGKSDLGALGSDLVRCARAALRTARVARGHAGMGTAAQ